MAVRTNSPSRSCPRPRYHLPRVVCTRASWPWASPPAERPPRHVTRDVTRLLRRRVAVEASEVMHGIVPWSPHPPRSSGARGWPPRWRTIPLCGWAASAATPPAPACRGPVAARGPRRSLYLPLALTASPARTPAAPSWSPGHTWHGRPPPCGARTSVAPQSPRANDPAASPALTLTAASHVTHPEA
jgi:hypothetical protein